MIRLIAAIDRKRGMAKNGGMPWHIPSDERYFTDMTMSYGGNVLSGGATFREAYKSVPLAQRTNYILTRNPEPIEGAFAVHNLDNVLADFSNKDLWVAGGSVVFEQVMASGKADELYLTLIEANFGCDQFFPEYSQEYELKEQSELREENGFIFSYAVFRKIR